MPAIASQLYLNNQHLPAGDVKINLQGVGIGNGLIQPLEQYKWYAPFAWNYTASVLGKPVISNATYQEMLAATPTCINLIQQCNSPNATSSCSEAYFACNYGLISPYQATGLSPYNFMEQCTAPPLCADVNLLTRFFNNPATQHTLGVSFVLWLPCDPLISELFQVDWTHDFQQDIVPLLEANPPIPALIYNGDYDFICNWWGGQAVSYNLPWSGQKSFQSAPIVDFSVAGEAKGQLRTYGPFSFLRVFKAGHMVPGDQPQAALAMLNRFIFKQPLTADDEEAKLSYATPEEAAAEGWSVKA